MKQQQTPADSKPATTTTPVEIEPTDEFQPAYGRGGPVRSDEPERDWFFEDSAQAESAPRIRRTPKAQPAESTPADGTRPADRT